MTHSLLFALSLALALAGANEHGETAKQLAVATSQGLALAVQHDQRSSATFRDCVTGAGADQFNNAAQRSLVRQFTAAEIAQLDLFNASATGHRYNQYNYEAFQRLHGVEVTSPTHLSSEDVAILRSFGTTDLGKRYMARLETGQWGPDDPLSIAVSELIRACQSRS